MNFNHISVEVSLSFRPHFLVINLNTLKNCKLNWNWKVWGRDGRCGSYGL